MPSGGRSRLLVTALMCFIFSVASVVIVPFWTLPLHLEHNPDDPATGYIFTAIMLSVSLWALIFMVGATVAGLWRASILLELHDGELVGYNYWKRRKAIRLDEIKTIQTEWTSFLHGLYPNVKVITGSGEKIVIHHGVRPLGKCVEAIRKRAVNVGKVDYRGLDKKRKSWGAVD